MNIPTLYGDTDSIFLQLPGALDYAKFSKTTHKLNLAIQEMSKAKFGEAIDTEIEIDYYADRAFFTDAKKRYLMHVVLQDDPPKPCDYVLIKGFETVRRDSTELLKSVQKLIFEPLLKGVTPIELEKQYKAHFTKLKSDLFAGKLDDKIVFTKGIRKELSSYESSLPHTRAAKIMQDLGNYQTGSDIEFVVISSDKETSIKPCGKCTNCKANGNKKYGNLTLYGDGAAQVLCLKPKKTSKEFIDTYPNVPNRPAIKQSGYAYVWQTQVVAILERLGMYLKDKEITLPPTQQALSQYWLRLPYSPLMARGYA